jgi:Protein of unknown function (DUF3500)
MNDKQRTMLLDLVGEWAGIINEHSASARMAELRADLNETWFAWSGPTTFEPGTNITAYYRVQGRISSLNTLHKMMSPRTTFIRSIAIRRMTTDSSSAINED